MKLDYLVIEVENEAYNQRGFLKYLQQNPNGQYEFELTDSFRDAVLYKMEDFEDKDSILRLHFNTLSDEFPRLQLSIKVLTVETKSMFVYEEENQR